MDLAIQEKNQRIALRLIQLGAISAPHPFGPPRSQPLTSLSLDHVTLLKKRDLALRCCMHKMAFANEEVSQGAYYVSFSGPHFEEICFQTYVLSKSDSKKEEVNLLKYDSDYNIQPLMNNILSKVSTGAFEAHSVTDPSGSGVGFAVQSFFDLLVIQGVAYAELIKVSIGLQFPEVLLMRQKIEGHSLTEVLQKPDKELLLKPLNPSGFLNSLLPQCSLLLDYRT